MPLWFRGFQRFCRVAALVFSVPSSIISAYILILPNISINSNDALTPKKNISYVFEIKNEGHVPVYNLFFACRELLEGNKPGYEFADSEYTLKLRPGESTSAKCLIATSSKFYSIRFATIVSYSWIFPLINSSSTAEFYAEGDGEKVTLRPTAGAQQT